MTAPAPTDGSTPTGTDTTSTSPTPTDTVTTTTTATVTSTSTPSTPPGGQPVHLDDDQFGVFTIALALLIVAVVFHAVRSR